MNWNISSYSRAAGGTLSISANYNEAVTVTGNPTLAVNNSARANHTLTYSAAASTANRMTFTLVIAAGHSSLQDGDVLSISGTNKISLSGGGVVGADGQAALITHAAGLPGNLEADA
jgi:imidazole glycerol phosphate synthase subunit HisF